MRREPSVYQINRQTAGIDPNREFPFDPGTDGMRKERPSLKQAATASVRP